MRIAKVDVDLVDLPAVTPPLAWRTGLRGSADARCYSCRSVSS
jgi:hypothetical protein